MRRELETLLAGRQRSFRTSNCCHLMFYTRRVDGLPSPPPYIDAVQIFAYLYPLDLLSLMRSSKQLCYILVNRSARLTWLRALAFPFPKNVYELRPPPKCPLDLGGPAFASLILESICSV
jgi:hypothetical protein